METFVGKKIRIINMEDPYADRYIGKEGIVMKESTDPWGETRLDGTWGGVALFPNVDTIEIIE